MAGEILADIQAVIESEDLSQQEKIEVVQCIKALSYIAHEDIPSDPSASPLEWSDGLDLFIRVIQATYDPDRNLVSVELEAIYNGKPFILDTPYEYANPPIRMTKEDNTEDILGVFQAIVTQTVRSQVS